MLLQLYVTSLTFVVTVGSTKSYGKKLRCKKRGEKLIRIHENEKKVIEYTKEERIVEN